MKLDSKKLLTTLTCSVVLASMAQVADAGTGSSYSQVQSAINTNGAGAIITELERAERLICPACVAPVMKLLDNDDYAIREVAAWWISRRPAQKKQVTAMSEQRLATGNSIEVRNAADALGTFRHPQAIPALVAAYANRTDLSDEARSHIMFALGTIGYITADATLERGMSDPSADVRMQAVSAWVEIRGQKGAAPAVALVNDPNTAIRRKAAAAIGFFRDPAGRTALEAQVLNDPDPVVRRNAAWALGQIGDVASADVLQKATQDESSLVRATAKVAKRALR